MGPELHVDASAWDRRNVWASHATAHQVLETVVPIFEQAGIETLAVKGVVTAHTLYADPSERPLGDVDLRIRPENFRRAVRVAEEAGWRIADQNDAYGAFAMFVGSLTLSVDVESVVGAPGLCGLSVGEMLSRATRGVGGADVRVPEIHDHAVLLCVNLFKDKFVFAFPWSIEDGQRIVEADGFDAGTFVERARRAKIAGIAWIVADWMVTEKGSAGWARVKERLGGERAPRPIYARLFRWLREKRAASIATRVMARVGADDAGMWVEGLWRAGGLEVQERRKVGAGGG